MIPNSKNQQGGTDFIMWTTGQKGRKEKEMDLSEGTQERQFRRPLEKTRERSQTGGEYAT